MKFSMTGQEKGDLLIQVTAWAGLTVFLYIYKQLLSDTCDQRIDCFYFSAIYFSLEKYYIAKDLHKAYTWSFANRFFFPS